MTIKMWPQRVDIVVAGVDDDQILLPGRVEELAGRNNKHLQPELRG